MIPDGPLHPTDALLALAAGSLAGALVRASPRRWVLAVVLAFVTVGGRRHGTVLLDAVPDRPAPVVPAVISGVVVVAAMVHVDRRRPPAMRVVFAVLVALAALWARVPDTEVPLIAAATIVGAIPWLRPRYRARSAGMLLLLPVAAALAGTLGRTEQLPEATVSAGVAGLAVYVAMTVISRSTRWAGTPTTVVPGATSSSTTAPAPTIAP